MTDLEKTQARRIHSLTEAAANYQHSAASSMTNAAIAIDRCDNDAMRVFHARAVHFQRRARACMDDAETWRTDPVFANEQML